MVQSGEIRVVCAFGAVPMALAVACSASSGSGPPYPTLAPTPTAMPTPTTSLTSTPPEPGPPFETFPDPWTDPGAPCDPTRAVPSDGRALLVKEPEVLVRFPLERTLSQIITTAGVTLTPAELLQRLFDTANTAAGAAFANNRHCDDQPNFAFGAGKPADCPRAEGKLATSTGLLSADGPDSFIPVALVNRFDLMPDNLTSCGEYRIVYAKRSGLTDPNDRLFIIFEGALLNSNSLAGCRRVAELWAGLDALGTPDERAAKLEAFFYAGTDGSGPVVDAASYGFRRGNCTYEGVCGQVRVAEGMQAPLRFREFRVSEELTDTTTNVTWPVRFEQRPLVGTPRPELFDPAIPGLEGANYRAGFPNALRELVDPELPRLRFVNGSEYASGESAVDGPARPDYASRVANSTAGSSFAQIITDGLAALPDPPPCPVDDPVTPAAILERATAMTCAGCHAPERLLSTGRHLGCGDVWPKSLGEAHIDEHGNLSPALVDLFLPHRAKVLATYLQACDINAIQRNLQPSPSLAHPECLVAGTEVTMADGSRKAIERIEPGDLVVSFDVAAGVTVPARVERTFVRADTDYLVVVGGSIVATPNHAFHTERGWISAEFLRTDDVLVHVRDASPTQGGGFGAVSARVGALETRPGSVTTYNLAVSGHHDFFAGGVLVHDGP